MNNLFSNIRAAIINNPMGSASTTAGDIQIGGSLSGNWRDISSVTVGVVGGGLVATAGMIALGATLPG